VPALTNPQSQVAMLPEGIEERSRANSRQAKQHELGFTQFELFSATARELLSAPMPANDSGKARDEQKSENAFLVQLIVDAMN
jgi:hypothetical protein